MSDQHITKADVEEMAANDTKEAKWLNVFADLAQLDGNPLKAAQLRADADKEAANAEGWAAVAADIQE